MLVSVIRSCSLRTVRAFAAGLVLCLLLSGCLFGSGNKKDTLHDGQADAPPAKAVRYAVDIRSKPENAGLVSELRENSQLVWLRSDLPDSRVGLERRMLEDVETARKILHSQDRKSVV